MLNFRFSISKVQNFYWKYRGFGVGEWFWCLLLFNKAALKDKAAFWWLLSFYVHVFKVWHILWHQLELTSLYQWHLWWTKQMWMNCCRFDHFFNTCCAPNLCSVIKFFKVDGDLLPVYHLSFIASIFMKILLTVPVKFTLTADLPRYAVLMQHFENLIKIQDNVHIFGSAWAN
jgi:hypothetical protein